MYIFYDTEATGLDIDFTQLLQVAMVFADDDLNILSSKKTDCRRTPWTIPSPGAMLITGFKPDDLKNAKFSHYAMMRDLVNWMQSQHWPVTFVGYNSLHFDEPALERNLATNLLPSGITTAANAHNSSRNIRFDIFPLVKLVAHYYPGALKLDVLNDYGKPSMSLMNVAQQNGVALSANEAHDAMNDIRATIGVAQLLRAISPDLWQHMHDNMTSPQAVARYMSTTPVVAYTDAMFGRNNTFAATDCGGSKDGTRRLVFDLAHDPAKYAELSVEDLAKLMRKSFDRSGNTADMPFRLMYTDGQPNVTPVDMGSHLIADYSARRCANRAKKIADDAAFRDRLQQALELVHGKKSDFNKAAQPPMMEQMFNHPVAPDVAPRLEQWISSFHAASDWQVRAQMARSFAADFADDISKDPSLKRFGKYAGRIVFDNAPFALNADEVRGMMTYIAKRSLTTDTQVKWNTIPKARKELEQIERDRTAGKDRWKHVTDSDIRTLKLYYTALEKELAPYVGQNVANNNQPPAPQQNSIKPPKAG